MLQIEYYLTNKNAEGFLAVARTAQAGAFRNNSGRPELCGQEGGLSIQW